MMKNIASLVLGLTCFVFVSSAHGQYAGPVLKLPLPPGSAWGVNTIPGSYWTHDGRSFYSIDFDDDIQGDGVGDLGAGVVDVLAAAPGTASLLIGHSQYGDAVVLDHGNCYETVYAHLHPNTISVSEGENVVRGQSVGKLGNSGQSTGAHVHFQVRCNGDSSANSRALAGVEIEGIRFIDYRVGNFYISSNIYTSAAPTPPSPPTIVGPTPATSATHFCDDEAVSSQDPDHIFSCTRVTNVMLDGETPVIEEGNLLQLNAHYTDVHGSGVSLRVYVDRDDQRFTFENTFVGGQAVSSTLIHDEGPWNYTEDPHTAYVLPKISNVRRASGASSSIYRFYICLDRAGETTDYATCKAQPDFRPAPSIEVVAVGAIPPQPTLVTSSVQCPPSNTTP